MITVSWVLLIQLAAAVLGVIDGIRRIRARGGVLPILELIVAGLLGLSLFIALPFTLGSLPLIATLALVLAIVIALLLITRSGRGVSPAVAIVALVLSVVVVLMGYGWLHIPGIN